MKFSTNKDRQDIGLTCSIKGIHSGDATLKMIPKQTAILHSSWDWTLQQEREKQTYVYSKRRFGNWAIRDSYFSLRWMTSLDSCLFLSIKPSSFPSVQMSRSAININVPIRKSGTLFNFTMGNCCVCGAHFDTCKYLGVSPTICLCFC